MAASQAQHSLVAFRADDRDFALPSEAVQEVVPMAALSKPPGLPSTIEGFLNLAGFAIPVLRFGRLFGMPESPLGLYSQLIILRGSEWPVALLVETASEVLTVTDEELMPVRAEESFNECLEAELAVRGRTLHLFAPERLLLEQERQKLVEFREMEQRRLGELEGNGQESKNVMRET